MPGWQCATITWRKRNAPCRAQSRKQAACDGTSLCSADCRRSLRALQIRMYAAPHTMLCSAPSLLVGMHLRTGVDATLRFIQPVCVELIVAGLRLCFAPISELSLHVQATSQGDMASARACMPVSEIIWLSHHGCDPLFKKKKLGCRAMMCTRHTCHPPKTCHIRPTPMGSTTQEITHITERPAHGSLNNRASCMTPHIAASSLTYPSAPGLCLTPYSVSCTTCRTEPCTMLRGSLSLAVAMARRCISPSLRSAMLTQLRDTTERCLLGSVLWPAAGCRSRPGSCLLWTEMAFRWRVS